MLPMGAGLGPSNQTRTAQCGCTCRNAAQTACARTEASLRGRMSVFERSSGSWMEGGSTWALASPAATLARNRPRRRLEKLQVCEKLYTVPQNCWKSGGQSCARAGELRAILYSSVGQKFRARSGTEAPADRMEAPADRKEAPPKPSPPPKTKSTPTAGPPVTFRRCACLEEWGLWSSGGG